MSADAHARLAERAVARSPGYRAAWKAFCAWCREHEQTPLPATPEALLGYITHRYRVERRAATTLDVAVHAIVKAHEGAGLPSPVSPALRDLVWEARLHTPQPMSPHLDEVRAVVRACGEDVTSLRDRAMLLSVHHGRLSRVRVISLDIEHLAQPALAALRQRHSEPLLCPALAIERWLAARGHPEQGPLFVSVHSRRFGGRLHPPDVARVLHQRCDEAGIRRLSARTFRLPPIAPR